MSLQPAGLLTSPSSTATFPRLKIISFDWSLQKAIRKQSEAANHRLTVSCWICWLFWYWTQFRMDLLTLHVSCRTRHNPRRQFPKVPNPCSVSILGAARMTSCFFGFWHLGQLVGQCHGIKTERMTQELFSLTQTTKQGCAKNPKSLKSFLQLITLASFGLRLIAPLWPNSGSFYLLLYINKHARSWRGETFVMKKTENLARLVSRMCWNSPHWHLSFHSKWSNTSWRLNSCILAMKGTFWNINTNLQKLWNLRNIR